MSKTFFKMVLGAVAVAGLALAGTVSAAPFNKQISFQQPDGTTIQLHGWGDEFNAVFETQDGFTVVFDQSQRAYCFARQEASGQLVSTGVQAHVENPATLGLVRHERMSSAARKQQVVARWQRWEREMQVQSRWQAKKSVLQAAGGASTTGGASADSPVYAPPSSTTLGNRAGLTLLVDFSDDPATVPQAEIVNFCNGDSYTGYGNNGSVKSYYYDNSGGLLTYTNVVTIYVRVPQLKTYYNDTSKDCGDQANLLIKDALDTLKARADYATVILPTFSNLTVDGGGRVLACNVFYTGGNGGVWMFGLWPHSWSLFNVGAQALGNGKSIYRYQISNIGNSLELATFCHENGHMLCDYPDLYDYDYDSIGGAGNFCLMGYSGSDAKNPSQICAYLKRGSGWGNTIALDSTSSLVATVGTAGTNFNRFYRYQKPGVPTEYFLVENRQKTGRDAQLPAAGLAIWHVDELGDRDNQSTNFNSSHLNYELSLMQADNLWHFQNDQNYGDANDLYYAGNTAGGYTNEFSDTSSPGARWWDGSASGLRMTAISIAAATMTFNVGTGVIVIPPIISAPLSPYGTNLNAVAGGDPNGNWYLFVQDDTSLDTGAISNGWLLTLTTANLVGGAGDLEISMSASANTVGVGSNLVYIVGVTNYGPSASSNVVVADTLPFGVTVISSNKTQGTVIGSTTALTWNVGTLATNGGARLTFTGQPAYAGNIVNAATASATTTDPNPDNDAAEVAVNVVTSPWPPSLSDIYTDVDGVVHFSITNGVGAGAIIIQAATNLVSPVNWVGIYTNTPPFDFSYDVTTNYPARFYRALVGP